MQFIPRILAYMVAREEQQEREEALDAEPAPQNEKEENGGRVVHTIVSSIAFAALLFFIIQYAPTLHKEDCLDRAFEAFSLESCSKFVNSTANRVTCLVASREVLRRMLRDC